MKRSKAQNSFRLFSNLQGVKIIWIDYSLTVNYESSIQESYFNGFGLRVVCLTQWADAQDEPDSGNW
jgi:hypothetical protein